MTRKIVTIEHNGQTLTLSEAAKLVGISDYCIRERYNDGQRGAELLRPNKTRRFRKEAAQLDDLKAKREAQEAAERAEREQRQSRQRRSQEARVRAMAEHAMAFSRPLIDAKLVKPKERLAIVERIKNCGQLNWRADGGSVL